jgi:RNA polymerase sigma-70 factor (ECF subfamily)
VPLEYEGRELVARFHSAVTFREGRTYQLVATRANGQLAFGAYLRDRNGQASHAMGLLVLTLRGDKISAITRFDNSVLPRFGLPRTLPG